jgi:ATP/maltotriose-dependent transcriptional regulator MalT
MGNPRNFEDEVGRKASKKALVLAFQWVTPNRGETPIGVYLLVVAAVGGEGMTNKETAMNLKVSKYTVKNHLSRIMAQLRAGGYSLSA